MPMTLKKAYSLDFLASLSPVPLSELTLPTQNHGHTLDLAGLLTPGSVLKYLFAANTFIFTVPYN